MQDTISLTIASLSGVVSLTSLALSRRFLVFDRNSAAIQEIEKARIADRKELSDQLERTIQRQELRIDSLQNQLTETNTRLFHTQQDLVKARAEIVRGENIIIELQAENEQLRKRVAELEREVSGNVIGHIAGTTI